MRAKPARLTCFCTPEELARWIDELCDHQDLGWICYIQSSEHGICGTANISRTLQDAYRAFLHPLEQPPSSQLHLNDVKSRSWGWVDITPGALKRTGTRTALTITVIVADEGAESPRSLLPAVNRLKRKVRAEGCFGVQGNLTKGEGRAFYPAIGYTQKAAHLYEAGTLWKQEGVEYVTTGVTP